MARISWTVEAQGWLRDIYDYIATDNPRAAAETVDGIYERAQALMDFPELGARYRASPRHVRVLPPWLTRSHVNFSWLGSAAIGATGFALYLRGWSSTGLLTIGLYAAFGFDGPLHYSRAPFDAHTVTMSFTIWFEVVAAAAWLWHRR
ncbi:MAG: type II toxin-antitoxin system RelE/ParE family toxin [Steroidobacteraceae bacterium]